MVASAPGLIEDVFRALAAQQGPYVPLNFCPFHNSASAGSGPGASSGSGSSSTTLGGLGLGFGLGGGPSAYMSGNAGSGNSSPTRLHHYFLRSSNTPLPPVPPPLYGHSYLGAGGMGGSSSSSSREPGASDGNPPRKRMRVTMSSTPLAGSPVSVAAAPFGSAFVAAPFASASSAAAASGAGMMLAAELAASDAQADNSFGLGVGPVAGLGTNVAPLYAGSLIDAVIGVPFRSSVVETMPLLARELESGPSMLALQQLSHETRSHSGSSSGSGSPPAPQHPSSAGNSPAPPPLPGAALGSTMQLQDSARPEQ